MEERQIFTNLAFLACIHVLFHPGKQGRVVTLLRTCSCRVPCCQAHSALQWEGIICFCCCWKCCARFSNKGRGRGQEKGRFQQIPVFSAKAPLTLVGPFRLEIGLGTTMLTYTSKYLSLNGSVVSFQWLHLQWDLIFVNSSALVSFSQDGHWNSLFEMTLVVNCEN